MTIEQIARALYAEYEPDIEWRYRGAEEQERWLRVARRRLELHEDQPTRKKLSALQIREARRLSAEGWHLDYIAREFRCSSGYLCTILGAP